MYWDGLRWHISTDKWMDKWMDMMMGMDEIIFDG